MPKSSEPRTAMVTGATGAIGKAIAQKLADTPGFSVVLVARNEAKARQAVETIITATGNEQVRYEIADLSRKADIAALAKRWQGPLHVLVNNAAVSPRHRQETPEGIEMQFAVNVLSYVWMIEAFKLLLKASAPARIVNVASYWAGDLDLDDLEFRRRRYDNNAAYRQSKQANRMLTSAYAERLHNYNITVNAAHPGDVNSKLSNDLGFGGHQAPEDGARTPVWLATASEGGEMTGKYFEDRREIHDPFALDKPAIERLFELCQSY